MIEPYYEDRSTVLFQGDALDVLVELPDKSVDCCVTSPPYWGLRDYGNEKQIGLEQSPEEYVGRLVNIFSEVSRVLRDDGTVWLNLGDSYANDGKFGGETGGKQHYLGEANRKRVGREKRITNLKPKDLVGIPWRVAFALQAAGWYLRSDIIWHKPNPMPESVKDRCTKAHEYIFLLSKSEKYFYDADAIKEPVTGGAHSRGDGVNPKARAGKNEASGDRRKAGFNERWKVKQNESFSAAVSGLVDSRNRRSVWTVATKPFPEAHFAVFPPDLIKPCILAGCPDGGIVLDPFVGAGTTCHVAKELGCDSIGIDLNAAYLEMAKRRLKQEVLPL